MIVDRSAWGRLRVTGSDRVRFLQGLTTVNVEQLADGAHAWGAILSPKGRVLSVIDLARVGESLIVSCEAVLAQKTHELLDKYAVMDDVVFEPITGPAHQQWDDVASVWYFGSREGSGRVERASAGNMKRTWVSHGRPRDWFDPARGAGPEFLREACQVKNIWVPYGA